MLRRRLTKAISWTTLFGGKSGPAAANLAANANANRAGTVRARLHEPVPANFFAIKPTRRQLGDFIKRITRGAKKPS